MSEEIRRKIDRGEYDSKIPYTDIQAYLTEQGQLTAKFWGDVHEQYDADRFDQKKWKALCTIAWQEGHSSGFSEVLYWIDILIELIEP